MSVDPASLNQNEASSTFFDINEIFSGDLEIDGINDWGDDTSRAEEQKGAISDKIEESKEDEIDENMLQVDYYIVIYMRFSSSKIKFFWC